MNPVRIHHNDQGTGRKAVPYRKKEKAFFRDEPEKGFFYRSIDGFSVYFPNHGAGSTSLKTSVYFFPVKIDSQLNL